MQKIKTIGLEYYKQWILALLVVLLTYVLLIYKELASILAGVAILLVGMMNLSDGFKTFSGGFLERILARSTNTKPKSIIFGVISTIIMQSSTLISVISISFLSAGLISLTQGIGILFGANLGNSAGSWLIVGLTSINISVLATPLIVIGVLLFFQKDKLFKGIGMVFMGIGFFFLGVDYIKNGFESVKHILDLSRFNFDGFKGILIFVGLGALLTGVVQSSHATLAIIISALISGQIHYENALAATLGTSVGGVVTALLASLSANVEGKKLALANCIFNFGIAVIIIAFFPYFVHLVDLSANILSISAENFALKTALFHTLFNLTAVLLFSAFIDKIVIFLDKFIKTAKDKDMDEPLYLEPNLVQYTDTAIEALRKESEHLCNNACRIIAHSIGFKQSDIKGDKSFDELIRTEKWIYKKDVNLDYLYKIKIKVLFEAILDFSTKMQSYTNDEEKNHEIFALKMASKNLTETSKDLKIIQNNIKKYSASSNHELAEEYNIMRKNLGELLRSIEELKIMKKEKRYLIIKNFTKAKEILKESDTRILKKIENLIADKKITAAEGISILNDSSFIEKISIEIIEAIEIIYTKDIEDIEEFIEENEEIDIKKSKKKKAEKKKSKKKKAEKKKSKKEEN